MFETLNKSLEQAYINMRSYEENEIKLHHLKDERAILHKKVSRLESKLEKERLDVKKITEFSFKGLVYKVLRKEEQQLVKEQEEVHLVEQQYHQAKEQLQACEAKISRLTDENSILRTAKATYELLYRQKYEEIRQLNTAESNQLLALEDQIALDSKVVQELEEALSVGNRLFSCLSNVLESLDSAKGYGVWDMVGGGIIATAGKHSHLDTAQSMLEDAKELMKKFKKELSDIQVTLDSQVNIEGFSQFADFFFDGFLVDWFVQSKINRSIERISDARQQILKVLGQLVKMQENTKHSFEQKQIELANLIKEFK